MANQENRKRDRLGKRITAVQSALMWIMAIILIAGSYFAFRRVYLNFYNSKAQDIVQIVAAQTDWEQIEHYAETGEPDEYSEELQVFYDNVKERFKGVAYLYLFVPEDDSFTYILEAQIDGDDPANISEWGEIFEYTEYEYENLVPDVNAGRASSEVRLMEADLGLALEVWAPVFDDEGNLRAMVEADYMVANIDRSLNSFVLTYILFFIICIAIVNVIIFYYLRRNLSEPIRALNDGVDAYEHGEMAINRAAFKHEDELSHLADSFGEMTRRIKAYNDEITRVTAEKERIGAELNVATKIQEDMLPQIFPAFPERPEIDVYATMNPAKEVGGDFYDYFMIDDDHVALVIADVSSKGVPAALFMVIAKTLIKNQTQHGGKAEDVFSVVNNQLCEGNDEGMFVTAFMAIITISTGKMIYVNAGHEPFLHRHDGEWSWIQPKPGFILAGLPDFEYTSATMQLAPGDRLYMFTDGVTEAQNSANELYGEDRLFSSIKNRGDEDFRTMLSDVRADIDAFVGDAAQFDDITMLVFEYRGK